MAGGSKEETAAGGKGVWGRLLAKILDNIQVTIGGKGGYRFTPGLVL